MAQRRDFFRQLIGHAAVVRDEIRGVENIPLRRLNELPPHIIEQIEPMFFPDEIWYLNGNVIDIPESKFSKGLKIELSEMELIALNYLRNGIRLKPAAIKLSENFTVPFEVGYPLITSLFFRLAALRICHPREVYHFDQEISNSQ
jgi:hypothetical protein